MIISPSSSSSSTFAFELDEEDEEGAEIVRGDRKTKKEKSEL